MFYQEKSGNPAYLTKTFDNPDSNLIGWKKTDFLDQSALQQL
jgi:hypothetical protein